MDPASMTPHVVVEETLEEWAIRNFGEEAFQRLIEPMSTGTYAGDPAKLSAKAAFPKVRRS